VVRERRREACTTNVQDMRYSPAKFLGCIPDDESWLLNGVTRPSAMECASYSLAQAIIPGLCRIFE